MIEYNYMENTKQMRALLKISFLSVVILTAAFGFVSFAHACWDDSCGDGCPCGCVANFERACRGNDLYWYDSCGNEESFIQTCANGCDRGACIPTPACTGSAQQRCVGNSMYWYDSCGNQGSYVGSCNTGYTGYTGYSCTQNYQQRCVGVSMYWYDSCGNQGSYVGSCGQNYNNFNGTLTVTKTVKDLTNGSAFSTSTSANPSDMLMFMITLQANGGDVQNVVVRDTIPTNLIYSNQLVVARSNNSSNNYSGDIVSGINLSTIPMGQTVTITYQAQLAGNQSFTYGTTTLSDDTNTVTSTSGYIPTASASVIVTKATVLGASTVSTGLTNNFWIDSFFLPLLITLIGIWMWKAGMFFGIEKWLENKRKIRRSFKAERELSGRIETIRKSGRI